MTLIIARYRQNGEILNDKLGSMQCRRETGEAGKNYGRPARCPGPDYVEHICVFLREIIIICRLYINPIHTKPVTLQLRAILSGLVQRFLARPSSLGNRNLFIFYFPHRGPKALWAALIVRRAHRRL